MNPKAKRILLWALLVSLILVCGITVAYLFRATNDVTNELVPGRVDCEVHEVADGTSATNGTVNTGSKSSITVKNTGNIKAWLRVRLVSYWVDANGDIMPVASPDVSFTLGEDWVAGKGDNTYIFTTPVAPDGVTGNLLGSSITLTTKTVDGVTCYQVVEVFADAIQSEPTDAVTEAWGYTPASNTN